MSHHAGLYCSLRVETVRQIESDNPARRLIEMADRRRRTIVPLKSILATALALAFLPSAWAAEWKGSCDIRFRGSSSLHDFTGNVRCQPFHVGVQGVANGRMIVPSAEVAALAGEMDTGNNSRDRQMREMFQSDRFPRIRGIFRNIDPESFRQDPRRSPEGRTPLDFTL